ncbi:hypothetical protein Tco_1243654 [Tanacetum coccineum]
MNDRSFTVDFNTFRSTNGLDYNKGKYVAHPTPEAVKTELGKISTNARLPSTLDEGTRKSQPLPKGTTTDPKDPRGNVQPADKGLPSTVSNKGVAKTTSFLEGPNGDQDSEGLKPPADMEPQTNPVAALLDTEEVFATGDDMEEDTQANEEEHQSPSTNKDKHEPSHIPATQVSDSDSSSPGLKKYDNTIPLTERQLVKYLRKVFRVLFKKLTKEQWAQHEEAAVSYDDLRASIEGYYEENIDNKEQTDKVIDAVMNSLNNNNIARGNLLNALNGVTETLKAIQDAVKEDHAEIKTEVSLIRKDTSDIKSMMTEIYQAFKEPPSHTEGEIEDIETENKEENHEEPKMAVLPESSQAPKRVDKGKRIATDDVESQVKLVSASRVVREDPDEPVRVPYMINGKMQYLTNDEITEHLEKEELIKKAAEQARLLAITRPEVVKVDAKLKVLNKERSKKLRKSLTLRKHKFENYIWTISNRLKHEKITDIKIHPHTKPVVITVYRGTDRRNFEVHNPFAFGAFGITELDELREIIPKKKNIVVIDLMNSLSRRYERMKKIPEELGIQSALPALVPEQTPS